MKIFLNRLALIIFSPIILTIWLIWTAKDIGVINSWRLYWAGTFSKNLQLPKDLLDKVADQYVEKRASKTL